MFIIRAIVASIVSRFVTGLIRRRMNRGWKK